MLTFWPTLRVARVLKAGIQMFGLKCLTVQTTLRSLLLLKTPYIWHSETNMLGLLTKVELLMRMQPKSGSGFGGNNCLVPPLCWQHEDKLHFPLEKTPNAREEGMYGQRGCNELCFVVHFYVADSKCSCVQYGRNSGSCWAPETNIALSGSHRVMQMYECWRRLHAATVEDRACMPACPLYSRRCLRWSP